jgi:hypothetical protein
MPGVFHERLNPKQADPHDATLMVLGERLGVSANVPALMQNVRNGVRATDRFWRKADYT